MNEKDKYILQDYEKTQKTILQFEEKRKSFAGKEVACQEEGGLDAGQDDEFQDRVEEMVEVAHRIGKMDKEAGAVELGKILTTKERSRKFRFIWQIVGGAAAVVVLVMGWQFWSAPETSQIVPSIPLELTEVTVPTIVYEEEGSAMLFFDSLRLASENTKQANELVEDMDIQHDVPMEVLEKVRYNKILIPRGFTYRTQLPDGSIVVLNAGSELRYPTHFQDSVREVELIGEGYFEVAKSDVPFVVKAGSTQVKVYGTKFNVLYSEDLNLTEAVLLEGSIGMQAGGNEVRLAPDERAYCMPGDSLLQVEKVDATAYVNWLGTTFKYDGMRLDRIAWDLSRWYGVYIDMPSELKSEIYTMEFDKTSSIEWVMEALSLITGKQIKKEGGGYQIY